jgi:putative ABC transport system substrate-binding protein
MTRREFITLLGISAATPLIARAEQQSSRPVIGYLGSTSPAEDAFRVNAFRRGLSEAGYVEGQNVEIEYSWAEGRYDRFPQLAKALVGRKVAVVAAMGTTAAALAAKAATKTIPIVFITGGDPVKLGLVTSLNRPGGNLTGMSILVNAIVAKQAEMLHEVIPRAALIGFLVNPNNANTDTDTKSMHAAANGLGQKLLAVEASTERELEIAFATLVQRSPGGLVVDTDQFLNNRHGQIVALAARYGLPTVYPWRAFVRSGGLMSYGTDLADAYRQCGDYAARILKGEKPADMPVMQVTKLELVINLKTAKTLGLTFPLSLLGRADEVIE